MTNSRMLRVKKEQFVERELYENVEAGQKIIAEYVRIATEWSGFAIATPVNDGGYCVVWGSAFVDMLKQGEEIDTIVLEWEHASTVVALALLTMASMQTVNVDALREYTGSHERGDVQMHPLIDSYVEDEIDGGDWQFVNDVRRAAHAAQQASLL